MTYQMGKELLDYIYNRAKDLQAPITELRLRNIEGDNPDSASGGNGEEMDVRSVDSDEFIKGKTYRVVLYRYEDEW